MLRDEMTAAIISVWKCRTGSLPSPQGNTNPLFVTHRTAGNQLSQSQEWAKPGNILFGNGNKATIPGSPKAALETLHQARQDLHNLGSPENQLKLGSFAGHNGWARNVFDTRRHAKSSIGPLCKPLSIDIGEHED